jgi:hypothetical protein
LWAGSRRRNLAEKQIAREQKDSGLVAAAMLESGIGRAHNHCDGHAGGIYSAGRCLGECPGIWEEKTSSFPPVTVTARGTITAPVKAGTDLDLKLIKSDWINSPLKREHIKAT